MNYQEMIMLAELVSNSEMVPEPYRKVVKKGKDGFVENPSAVANCCIAIDIHERVGMPLLLVMQNLSVIGGRPAWSAQYVLAVINRKFSGRLEFETVVEKGPFQVRYMTYKFNGQKNVPVETTRTIEENIKVRAVVRLEDRVLEGSWIDTVMTIREGWDDRNGSKWQTLQEQMFRYRSATFFGRVFCPELLFGFMTEDEVIDTQESSIFSNNKQTPTLNQTLGLGMGDAEAATIEIPAVVDTTSGPQVELIVEGEPVMQPQVPTANSLSDPDSLAKSDVERYLAAMSESSNVAEAASWMNQAKKALAGSDLEQVKEAFQKRKASF